MSAPQLQSDDCLIDAYMQYGDAVAVIALHLSCSYVQGTRVSELAVQFRCTSSEHRSVIRLSFHLYMLSDRGPAGCTLRPRTPQRGVDIRCRVTRSSAPLTVLAHTCSITVGPEPLLIGSDISSISRKTLFSNSGTVTDTDRFLLRKHCDRASSLSLQ
jgi:hypothetical protein